jgi:hypothetical protein
VPFVGFIFLVGEVQTIVEQVARPTEVDADIEIQLVATSLTVMCLQDAFGDPGGRSLLRGDEQEVRISI